MVVGEVIPMKRVSIGRVMQCLLRLLPVFYAAFITTAMFLIVLTWVRSYHLTDSLECSDYQVKEHFIASRAAYVCSINGAIGLTWETFRAAESVYSDPPGLTQSLNGTKWHYNMRETLPYQYPNWGADPWRGFGFILGKVDDKSYRPPDRHTLSVMTVPYWALFSLTAPFTVWLWFNRLLTHIRTVRRKRLCHCIR